MLSQGIREIQILAQDTTRYGTDLYDEPRLMELLEKIDETIDAFVRDSPPEKGESEGVTQKGILHSETHPNPPLSRRE